MKTKTFLLLCLFLGMGLTQLSAQTVAKGAVVAVGVYEMTLNPDVSLNQFLDFYNDKYLPEWEKSWPGVKQYLMIGDRGDNKNKFGVILIFESVAVRDKYYPVADANTTSDAYNTAVEKMKVMNAERAKYVVSGTRTTYTDWIIK